MAKRLTQEIANIEYIDAANRRRVTQEIANVEYQLNRNYMRVSSMMVMVEYVPRASAGRRFGPAAQMTGGD